MSGVESVAAARAALLARIEALVGARDVARLDEALTHASFANETGARDNQRLEFLGDAVLGLCVSETLIALHPSADEGKLTRMRAALVNAEALAEWARRVDLGACIALGRGATLGSERDQTNVLADTVEAVIAAVYVAHGLGGARALVRDVIGARFATVEGLGNLDPKSALQERVQAEGMAAPIYKVVSTRGASNQQVFEVEVVVADRILARGEGRSKRLAERSAALAALAALDSGR